MFDYNGVECLANTLDDWPRYTDDMILGFNQVDSVYIDNLSH